MTPAAFADLADMLRRRSGLVLTPDKLPLAKSRLAPVAHLFGFKGVAALLAEFPHPREEIAQAVTEAMTTNETSFFRDREPFAHFRDVVLPALIGARASTRRVRIWCAAVATGQEAYSLAMLLDEANLASLDWKVDLIATDLSAGAVARAKDGVYSHFEVQRGLPIQSLLKHFTQEGSQWRVSDRLRRMVSFRPFNLLDNFGWLGEVDVVFCRNVLLYFDGQSKAAVFSKLADVLAPDGTLVLGATESSAESFVPADAPRGVFVRPRGTAPRAAAHAG
ncbi:MAG: protein-glutamate O-methyltransferase CheR [Rhizomicrobium sp.]